MIPLLLGVLLALPPFPSAPRAQEAPQAPREGVEAPAAGLQVVYLANEGFLLASGGRSVLIDAFVPKPYSMYAGVSDVARARMLAGQAPFERVDVALVSHVHRDHFEPRFAAAFLEAHPETRLVSSPEVVADLESKVELPEAVRGRLARVLPAPGEDLFATVGDVRVRVLRLSHGSGRFGTVQNLGHVIEVGSARVLHVGDAVPDRAVFDAYAPGELDLALVPYWYFQDAPGRALVRSLGARHVVAVHVPPAEVEKVRAGLALSWPEVRVFAESLESERLPLADEPR